MTFELQDKYDFTKKYQSKQLASFVGVGKTWLHHMTIHISSYIVFAFFKHIKQTLNNIE